MHLWETQHDTSLELFMRMFRVRLRPMAIELRAHCIRKLTHFKQKIRYFRGHIDDPNSSQDVETGFELVEILINSRNIRQKPLLEVQDQRLYVVITPKKLQKKLEANYAKPPIGWGLLFEEGIVLPRFLKVYLIVVVLLLFAALASYLLESVRYNGYAVFSMGSFFAMIITTVVTLTFGLLK